MINPADFLDDHTYFIVIIILVLVLFISQVIAAGSEDADRSHLCKMNNMSLSDSGRNCLKDVGYKKVEVYLIISDDGEYKLNNIPTP
jgi:hypothetical protein